MTSIKDFFSKWFFLAIILILLGLLIHQTDHQNKTVDFIVEISAMFLESIGIAILVANIFSFTIGTNQFLSYVRERLIDVVISKDFITRLSPREQKDLIEMTLKPPRELSDVYSGINYYFLNYIENSMKLFDSCYRGQYVVNGIASVDVNSGKLKVDMEIDYVIYRVAEKFDPLIIFFEAKDSEHIETILKSPDGEKMKIDSESLVELKEIKDPSMEQGFECTVPENFNKFRQMSVTRKIVEYGNDHWQVSSLKIIKPVDRLLLNIQCEEDLVVRRCDTYGVQEEFEIQISENNKRIRVSYDGWLSPGFGINILLARDGWHESTDKQIE
ncbi:MAG: hypothetical protein R3E90_15030 [Marinicella sp.]|nr:hypothetical protein [Xanthomonadales bacterium]